MVSLIDASMDKLENESAPFIPTVILHWTHFQTLSPYVFQNSCPSIIPPHSTAMIIFWRQISECFSSQVKTLKWVSFYLKLGSKSLLWPTQLRLSSLPTCEMDLPSRFLPHLTLAIFFLTLSWALHIFCVSLYFAHPGSRVLVSGIYRTFYISACEEEGRGDIDVTLYF